MRYIPKDPAWQGDVLDNLETLKAKAARLKVLIDDTAMVTLHYDPQNPYEALDTIYVKAREMEREIDAFYNLFRLAWGEIVMQIRGGEVVDLGLTEAQIADIQARLQKELSNEQR